MIGDRSDGDLLWAVAVALLLLVLCGALIGLVRVESRLIPIDAATTRVLE